MDIFALLVPNFFLLVLVGAAVASCLTDHVHRQVAKIKELEDKVCMLGNELQAAKDSADAGATDKLCQQSEEFEKNLASLNEKLASVEISANNLKESLAVVTKERDRALRGGKRYKRS